MFLSGLIDRGLGRKVNVVNGADAREGHWVYEYYPSKGDKVTQVVRITPLDY